MTEDETVPATSPRQAEDAYLAAVSALLVAIATNTTVTADEAQCLVEAMPDDEMCSGLAFALDDYGLLG